jgi:hypothetical protein
MTRPVRLVRSRAKGTHLTSPNGLPVVCVTRGTRWGNPFKLELNAPAHRLASIQAFATALKNGELAIGLSDVRRELRGKNLACWCKLDVACHADVLLALANEED